MAAKLRLSDLAKEIGVTSKAVMEKCRAEGIDVKSHASVIPLGLAATIREWFSEGSAGNAVEVAAHVDLEKAREEAKKTRRKKSSKTAEEPEKTTKTKDEYAEEQPAMEEDDLPAVEQPEESQQVEISADEHQPATSVAQEPEPAPEVKAAAKPQEKPAEPQSQTRHPAAEQQAEKTKHHKPAKEQPPEQAEIKPAGPQLIPKPATLKGPKVIRVEKPDFVRKPPPPRIPMATAPLPIPTTGRKSKGGKKGTEGEDDESHRRSPRRRTGRSADSGAKITEWRDQDLLERSERLAAAGGGLRRHRASVTASGQPHPAEIRQGKVEIVEPITVRDLSQATGIKTAAIIQKLMQSGMLATVNQVIDQPTAETVALEYGIELVVKKPKTAEEVLFDELSALPRGELVSRAPVVTFLGHVDHGKTSLLDYIRKETVAAGEAGGITQHIGAYRLDRGNSHVVFLDTPGHEAFTAMRSRGAKMTDVVVLVVAADDGIMPQTVEAISHAKAAKVPIVVAMNKIDLPNANEQKVLGQLAEHELTPREWGGNVEVIRTSATTGKGMDSLVETLSLEAELLELKADPKAAASGYVIEAKMDSGQGVIARLLVLDGTLKVGDIALAGGGYGRVRNIRDHSGKIIESAGPATPVEVSGLDEVPQAGDKFYIVTDLERARMVAEDRKQNLRLASLATSGPKKLEDLFGAASTDQKELALIIKADVQGSIEAIVGSLKKLDAAEVAVKVLHTAVGGITTGDVSLAHASNGIVIGFNVVADATARQMAESLGVNIKSYRIIYDIIEDVRTAMEKGLAPEIQEKTLGRVEIRQTFKVSRVGTIAGCHVLEGTINRNAKLRIIRNNIVVEDERSLESLKRFKDDAREVRAGMDCGMKVAGYDDIKEGDILEFYQKIEVARKL